MLRPVHFALLEVKRYLADRSDLAFSLALPIGLFALMYGVFGGGPSFSATAHIADRDGGAAAGQLIERVEAVDGVTVERYAASELDDALDRSAVLTGFVIPPGFTASLEAGNPAEVVVKRRGNGGVEGQLITSIVQGAVSGLAAEYELRQAVRLLVSESTPDAAVEEVAGRLVDEARAAPVVAVRTESLAGDESNYLDRLLPGIIVMFLLFSVTMSAQSLIEERRVGVLERLMTTRLTASQLFAGKFLAGWARGVAQSFVLIALAFVVLRVGGPSAFAQSLVLAAAVAAAVSAVGMTIASLARSQEQAVWSAVVVTMAMTLFGGTFFPIGDSGLVAMLSRFTVNKYAIDAFEGLLTGAATLPDHGAELAVMGGVAVAGLVVSRLGFRVSEGRR